MKVYYLRKGDVCPCCGEPIQTDDEETLAKLAEFAMALEGCELGRDHLEAVGFAWPEVPE